MQIKRILTPTDFSDESIQAVDYAVELAVLLDAEVVILFVLEPIYFASPADLYAESANLAQLVEEQRDFGRAQLSKLQERLEKRSIGCSTLLETGSPYKTIVDTAQQIEADLIVMATHGRSGVSHLLMGSVAEKVVRAAMCPVLTVRNSPACAQDVTV